MIIAVFSLGQFIASDLSKLKDGFESWFKEQGKPEITGAKVWDWMAKNLGPLRVDDITIDEFCEQFNVTFKVRMPVEQFIEIFQSMCTVDATSLARVSAFNDYLSTREDTRFILVSHTNKCHLNHILEQLEHILPGCEEAIIHDETIGIPSEKILFAPSITSKSVEHSETLTYALGHLDIDEDDEHVIISFLNTIQAYKHPHFSYVDAGKNLEPEAVIAAIVEKSPPAAGMSMR